MSLIEFAVTRRKQAKLIYPHLTSVDELGRGCPISRSYAWVSAPTRLQPFTQKFSTLMSFPIDVSWMPDFWGKIRNQVREYQYGAQVSAADLEVERLTEQVSLAQYYFEIRGQDALQKIFNDTVVADQKALDLTQGLYDTGIDDYISFRPERRSRVHRLRPSMLESRAHNTNMPSLFSSPSWPRIFPFP